MASNSMGNASYSGQISVIGSAVVREYNYNSEHNYNNYTVIAGRDIVLRCPAIGYPIESVVWTHKGNTLPVNHRQKIDQIISGIGGKLQITQVDKTLDAGEYICTVRTVLSEKDSKAVNNVVKASVMLNVRIAPQIDEHSLPQHIITKQGMRVKLMCSVVEGDPPIHMSWFKALNRVMPSDTISIQNTEDYSVLTFKSISHNDMDNWYVI
jgi:Down syndrome cell adhesion molecule